MPANENLFAALRAAFPKELSATSIEAIAPDGSTLYYTLADLDHASARIANLLDSLNLPQGARVAVQVEKSVETLALYLATLRAGLVFLPLNTAYRSAEIEYFVRDAEPSVVVCTPAAFGWVSKIAFQAGTQAVYTLGDDRTGSLLERAAHHAETHTPAVCAADTLAAIVYTSGTTGRSKGAMLTHGNLLANAVMLKEYWGWRKDDVLIHALPIFHVHGLFVAIHAALLGASKMLWFAKFDPAAVVAALPRATVFMGVPTLYVRMLGEAALNRNAVTNMRLFISGSAPLLIETFREWQERTGHTILERYGMSETTMLTSNPYGPDARYDNQSERRGGTVGFPLPGVDLRVADAQDRALPAGEIGGIQVRGASVFGGYWRMPEKTAQEFTQDGWFRTGDVGQVDARGYVHIVGRSKDLVISGGYNVYPAEIEGVLNELPGVQESAVVGVPHPDFGEVGVAVVVARPGSQPAPEALLGALKTQLANYKIPKHCVLVPDLPRNTMGKVQKNLLREAYGGLFAPGK
ncbi:MAG: malonyl-CoA synthase [Simplicispira suum]|uniref:malonate--CoA ligase n=1 Tax=Simplicispira suum TaxID=2109915 RepID=UPI001C6B4091|nr:malonyl-CoA synthase [Simplicispira suum]MBW7834545.1 malonyl-CoA synthase [Simplicispira suum]